MKFLFDDDTFSFEALRTTGFANYGGADLGEVLATANRITDGDQASWHRAWKATADRVAELGERSLAAGHRVTARENLLRASNYYRNAAAFVLDNPADDPEVAALYAAQIDTFAAATALFDHPAEAVRIPYQDTTLPGYLFLVDDSGTPRPTLICTSGYDSTSQECYFVLAVAALRRGYNVLAFDGPGQGGALHLRKLVMRPDWEAVITPVVDFALTRPEIQPGRIAGFGYSLGGYLLARAAAFEHRLAALILDDGVHDLASGFADNLPPLSGDLGAGRARGVRDPGDVAADDPQPTTGVGRAQRHVGVRRGELRRAAAHRHHIHPRRRRRSDPGPDPDHGGRARHAPGGSTRAGRESPHRGPNHPRHLDRAGGRRGTHPRRRPGTGPPGDVRLARHHTGRMIATAEPHRRP
jgi:hypothetical protein